METKSVKVISKSQDQKVAVCDGGGGALGHPKVYLPFGNKSEVICYYCGKRFLKS
ncbi:MAG: zinc-finger domain-containing protein [Pseudomonadota bacterium]